MAHDIEWLTPSGAPAPKRGKDSVEDTVSHLEPVRTAVYRKALSLGRDAEMRLAGHHRTGKAHVTVERHPRPGARTPDWYVYLKDADPGGNGRAGKNKADRSAMSIEFGWTQTHAFGKRLKSPRKHEGLHILGGALERAINRYTGPQ